MSEKISSLMDGELQAAEAERAIRSCCLSREEQDTWYLYHVIGDSLRGQAPRALVASTLGERLEKEPAIIARPKRRLLDTTLARVSLAAAASVATIGVVGWIGSQGGQVSGGPVMAKGQPGVQPVANTVPLQPAPTVNVQDYYTAHKLLPSPEIYRPVANRAPPAATR